MEHEIIDVDDFTPDVECTGADLDVEFIGHSPPSQQFPRQNKKFASGSNPPSNKRHMVLVKRDGPASKKTRYLDRPSPTFRPLKRERGERSLVNEIIVLSDDEDIQPTMPVRLKKSKKEPKCDADSEEDYEAIHQGFFIERHPDSNLHLSAIPSQIVESKIVNSFDRLLVSTERTNSKHYENRWGAPGYLSKPDPHGPYVWNKLALLKRLYRRPSVDHNDSRSACNRHEMFHNLTPMVSFRQAPGAINRIVQSDDFVAVCTSVTGGHEDRINERPDPYNTGGTLLVYDGETFHVGEGHCENKKIRGSETLVDPAIQTDSHSYVLGLYRKSYAINDVIFDPTCPTRIISSGNDRTVRLWKFMKNFEHGPEKKRGNSIHEERNLLSYLNDVRRDCSVFPNLNNNDEDYDRSSIVLENTVYFLRPVNDLRYKPGTSTLAVACQDGTIYIYTDTEMLLEDECIPFELAPRSQMHAAGAMVWGSGPTSDLLFASSEPQIDNERSGYHKAFDAHTQVLAHDFDVRDAGDAIALDSRNLALFTNGNKHLLHVLDARQRSRDRTPPIRLEASLWPSSFAWDVNTASFSPDGVYIVAGRSDNISHVYDSRFLKKGPVHAFEHRGPRRDGAGTNPYGIVEAQWVETPSRRKLGLVTGGIDGCVRFWDVTKASSDASNGRIIAQMESDIAAFSVGDSYKWERGLIVGDNANTVSIFGRPKSLANS